MLAPVEASVYLYSSGVPIRSGTFFSETVLESGSVDSMAVLSGGTAFETVIESGARMTVASGGSIGGINLESGGIFSGGGVASGYSKWYGPALCNTEGSATVSGGVFSRNAAIVLNGYPGQGGALESYAGSLRVSQSLFTENRAVSGGGGAILGVSAVLRVDSSVFSGNSARYGGAVEAGSGSAVISGCVFSGNSAEDGGAVLYHSGAKGVIRDAEFFSNAGVRGGAVQCNTYGGKTASVTISSCTFSANAAVSGGAVFNTGSARIADCSFRTADDTILNGGTMTFGGTVFLAGALHTDSVVNAAGARIVFDAPGRGQRDDVILDVSLVSGAEYAVSVDAAMQNGAYALVSGAGSWSGSLSVFCGEEDTGLAFTVDAGQPEETVIFAADKACTLTADGGILSLGVRDIGPVRIYSSGVLVSAADSVSGTVIEAEKCDLLTVLSGGTATDAVILSGGCMSAGKEAAVSGILVSDGGHYEGGGVLDGGEALNGAALRLVSASAILTDVEFTGNTVTAATWDDGFGGAVDNLAASILIVNGGTFASNQGENGGALANHIRYGSEDSISLSISGTRFETNAATYGGAVYNQGNAGDVALISDAVFTGNSASYGGGAVCNCYGDLILSGGTYSANQAGNDGGAVANWNNARIENAVFLENTATYGGAVSLSYGNTLEVFDASFTGNSAQQGGAVWLNSFSVSGLLDSCVFEGNTAEDGGAVYNETALTVKDCSFLTETDTVVNTGNLVLAGVITANAGMRNSGTLLFDLAEDAYLSDWTMLSGEGETVLSVSGVSGSAEFVFAGNAAGFTGTLSLQTDSETYSGVLSVGSAFTVFGTQYRLTLTEDLLGLSVSKADIPSGVRSDLEGNGVSQIAAWDEENAKIGYLRMTASGPQGWTGVWEWEEKNWKAAGTGRFAGSQQTYDGLLLYNTDTHTFAAWSDLNDPSYGYLSLGYADGDFQCLAVGDFNGDGTDDILIGNGEGSVGLLDGGMAYHDVYHSDGTPDLLFAGTGDFNGDGTDDILFYRKETIGGEEVKSFFAWSNQDATFSSWNWASSYLGSLKDSEWDCAGTGDFSGDGTDDILMRRSDGALFVWEDGDSSSQRYAGTLDFASWEIAAVGDYTGNGTEDILLRETVSGWGGLGIWESGYAGNWVDLQSAIETDHEGSRFSILA